MMQDHAQTLEVTAAFFVPAAKVELVLRRSKLYDGFEIKLNESHDEVAVSLSPLIIKNHTTAVFQVPPGLKTSLYNLRLKQMGLVSEVRLPLLVLARTISESEVAVVEPLELNDVGEQIIPMTLHGNVSLSLSTNTEISTFELPLIEAMRRQMNASHTKAFHDIELKCELSLSANSSSSCIGEATQVSSTRFSCQLDLPRCSAISNHVDISNSSEYLAASLTFSIG